MVFIKGFCGICFRDIKMGKLKMVRKEDERFGEEDFPDDPAVETLPFNAGYMGSIPGQVMKILKFYGATKPVHHSERSCMTQVLQERLFIVI